VAAGRGGRAGVSTREHRGPDRRVLRTLRGLDPAVHLLVAGIAINRMGSFVQVFLILFLTSRGMPAAQAGLALAAYGAGAVLGVLAGGAGADRLDIRLVIGTSMLLSGGLTGAVPFARPYPLLVAVCGGAGLAGQLYRPASSALLASLTPARHLVLASAAYRLGLNVGAAIAPLAGAFMISRSPTALFLADMGTSVAFGVIALIFLPRTRRAIRQRPPPGRYRLVVRDRRYLGFAVSLLLISVVEIQYVSTLPLQIVARGLPVTGYSLLVALNAILVIGAELVITRYVQFWPTRIAVTAGITLISAGIAAYGLPTTGALIAATVVWTFGEIIAAPSVSAYPAQVAPPPARGRYIALAAASQSIGYAIGPVAGTAIWQGAGGGVWGLCAAGGLASAMLSLGCVRAPAGLGRSRASSGDVTVSACENA
jgi:MFS family permease